MKTNLFRDGNGNSAQVVRLGSSIDIKDGMLEKGEERIIRIAAVSDTRAWIHPEGLEKEGPGVLLPAGTIEYVGIYNNDIVEITGEVNITECL